MTKEQLAQAIVITAEVIGHEISVPAAREIARELASYSPELVAEALRRCKRELSGRLTLAAVIQRIDDGHLGVDEAWALVPRSESDSVVWTDEIAEAYGVARPLLAAGDAVAARMAFKDSYTRQLVAARAAGRMASWWPSYGHDKHQRATVVMRAVELGRLPATSVAEVAHQLPASTSQGAGAEKRLGAGDRAETYSGALADDIQAVIAGLKGKA